MKSVARALSTVAGPRRTVRRRSTPAGLADHLAVLAVSVLLALAVGGSEWLPVTLREWLMIAALVPAGIAGALTGDRVGSWLKDQGIGRR